VCFAHKIIQNHNIYSPKAEPREADKRIERRVAAWISYN
jgi:hypothetical protein